MQPNKTGETKNCWFKVGRFHNFCACWVPKIWTSLASNHRLGTWFAKFHSLTNNKVSVFGLVWFCSARDSVKWSLEKGSRVFQRSCESMDAINSQGTFRILSPCSNTSHANSRRFPICLNYISLSTYSSRWTGSLSGLNCDEIDPLVQGWMDSIEILFVILGFVFQTSE